MKGREEGTVQVEKQGDRNGVRWNSGALGLLLGFPSRVIVLGPEPESLLATLVGLWGQPCFVGGELQPEGQGPALVLSE